MPLQKHRAVKNSCNNDKGMSLLNVLGIVYGRVLTERLMEVMEGKVSEEPGAFRKGKGCMSKLKLFAIKMVVKKYLGKGKKWYAAFTALEKVYDK